MNLKIENRRPRLSPSSAFRRWGAAAYFLLSAMRASAGNALDFAATVWTPDRNGAVSTNASFCQEWTNSLQWTWNQSPARLYIRFPKATEVNDKTHLLVWCYNEKPSPERLTVELMNGSKSVARYWYFLNYRGWRALHVPYRTIDGQSIKTLETFCFSAPGAKGQLCFSGVDFSSEESLRPDSWGRWSKADYQQPWLDDLELLDQPGKCLYSMQDISLNRPWLPSPEPVTDGQRRVMDELRRANLDNKRIGGGRVDTNRVNRLRTACESFGIAAKKSAPEWFARINEASFNYQQHLLYKGLMPLRFALIKEASFNYQVAKASLGESAPLTRELLGLLVGACESAVDQGLAEGAGPGGCIGYGNRDWPPLFFGVYADLEAHSARAPEIARMVAWYCGGPSLFREKFLPGDGDTDFVGLTYGPLLCAILMVPDPAERWQRLRAFSRMEDAICSRVDTNPFGPDGTAFHHGMHHYDYASYEIPVLIGIACQFAHTPLRLSTESYDTLKRWVMTMAWSACKYTMPASLPARPGDIRTINMASLAAQLAESGSSDGKEPVDREMAALFLALNNQPDDARAARYRTLGIEPYAFNGHRVLNTAATSIHRRDDWMLSIIGMNKLVRGLEIYGGAQNSYSSYAHNGCAWLVSSGDPVSCQASGWSFDGWDSNHYPGTTVALRDPQDLWGGYVLIGNHSTFAGGTDLDKDGIWGYEHRCGGIRFNKSAFCFGRRVTLLTSDIGREPKGPSGAFVTTLYQNAFAGDPAAEPCFADGAEIRGFPSEQTLAPGKAHWLLDNKGTGYYLHNSLSPIRLLRRPQTWTYMQSGYLLDKNNDPFTLVGPCQRGRFREKPMGANEKFYRPTTNRFALAYIEHGDATESSGCAYTLLVRATPEKAKRFASAMADPADAPYRILRQDERAHILWDRATDTTGYALFAAGETGLPASGVGGLLLTASRPCLVMVREEKKDALKLSVCSTDWSCREPLALDLRGAWRIVSDDTAQPVKTEVIRGMTTRIEIGYAFDKPVMACLPIRLTLAKVQW